jgi:hypothetical protein
MMEQCSIPAHARAFRLRPLLPTSHWSSSAFWRCVMRLLKTSSAFPVLKRSCMICIETRSCSEPPCAFPVRKLPFGRFCARMGVFP